MLQWICSVTILVPIIIDFYHGILISTEPINSPPAFDSSVKSTATENEATIATAGKLSG